MYIRPTGKISNTGPFFIFVICQHFTVAKEERNLFISDRVIVSAIKIVNLSRPYIASGSFHECYYS